jgi:hypothetical protein
VSRRRWPGAFPGCSASNPLATYASNHRLTADGTTKGKENCSEAPRLRRLRRQRPLGITARLR